MTRAKKIFALAALLAGCLLLLGENAAQSEARREEKEAYRNLELIGGVMSIIENHYVDSVDREDIIKGALRGMLSSLDPYSQFLDSDDLRELEIGTEGVFGGVGMVITVKDNMIAVVSPIEETPAYRAGMKPGDLITKIKDESTRGMTSRDAANLLRGEPGTDVEIEVLREGEPDLLKITLTREIIRLQSIRGAQLIEDSKIGYVRISEFQKETYNDLRQELEQLMGKGMSGLILDVRHNPGGLLDSAINVSDLFLPPNRLVVYTQGRDGARRQEFRTRRGDPMVNESIPMVVLIDRGSASGSEILAGALSDWNRAILMGEKTFGKASVQTVIPVRAGDFKDTAIKLTIAHYHTPKDRRIESEGLLPDIEVSQERRTRLEGEIELEKDETIRRAYDLLRGVDLMKARDAEKVNGEEEPKEEE